VGECAADSDLVSARTGASGSAAWCGRTSAEQTRPAQFGPAQVSSGLGAQKAQISTGRGRDDSVRERHGSAPAQISSARARTRTRSAMATQTARHGSEASAARSWNRPDQNGTQLAQRSARPDRNSAVQVSAARNSAARSRPRRISIRTGTQRDRRSAQRGRDATGAARHSRHTARCECGAAPARTSTGSARHKNGLARARCSVERAQTARHSAQRGRDGAKRNRLGAAQSMRLPRQLGGCWRRRASSRGEKVAPPRCFFQTLVRKAAGLWGIGTSHELSI
jgi:hypothetical protein